MTSGAHRLFPGLWHDFILIFFIKNNYQDVTMFDREMAEREGRGWLDSRLAGATEDVALIIRDRGECGRDS